MPRGDAAPEERLKAIETLLLWEGRVTRARLLELFDVHGTVASRDLSAFRAKYPDSVTADLSTKSYESTPWMRPILTQGKFDEYQRLIGATGEMPVRASVPVESANMDATRTSYWDFSKIHRAIRTGIAIVITYRSMQNPEPHKRTVRPHSLIQAGPRWHMRAYCDETNEFRDFNIGRIVSIDLAIDSDLPGPELDVDWNTQVELRLVPHSSLTLPQVRLVQEEFLSSTAALVIQVRKPIARYVVQAYRAATNPSIESPPAYLLMVHQAHELPDGTLWD